MTIVRSHAARAGAACKLCPLGACVPQRNTLGDPAASSSSVSASQPLSSRLVLLVQSRTVESLENIPVHIFLGITALEFIKFIKSDSVTQPELPDGNNNPHMALKMASASLAPLLIVAFSLFVGIRSSSSQQANTRFYELRFQSEVDNSTILKPEGQQQIFKCQIRLAPSSQATEAAGQRQRTSGDSRLRTLILNVPDSSSQQHYFAATLAANDPNSNETNRTSSFKPTNVSLTVDWFKDDQPISESELVSIINAELKSNNSSSSGGGDGSTQPTNNNINGNQKNDKRNKARIEVKNTSNGNQLKLTSRLKIGQLRSSDSGHYKCLAKASFQLVLPSAVDQQQQQPAATKPHAQVVHLIEQSLESNSAILGVVSAASLGSHSDNSSSSVAASKGNAPSAAGRKHNDVLHANGPSDIKLDADNRGVARRDQQEPKDALAALFGWFRSAAPLNQRSQQQQSQRPNDNGAANGNMRRNSQAGQFVSDDEDLARQIGPTDIQQPSNFISGATNEAPTSNSSSNNQDDNDDETPFRWRPPQLPADQDNNGLQWSSTGGQLWSGSIHEPSRDSAEEPANNDIGINIDANNDSLSASGADEAAEQRRDSPFHNHNNRAPNSPSSSGHWQGNPSQRDHQQQQQHHHNHHPQQQPHKTDRADKYLNSGADRLGGLAKLVHRIAPELGCYITLGEHYRGTWAQIADGRHCLSWAQAVMAASSQQHLEATGAAKSGTKAVGSIFRAEKLDDIHHNHCRNPTRDPRGPWCFVQYKPELDLGLASGVMPFRTILISGGGGGGTSSSNNNNNDSMPQYIQRPCSVAPCSEYLWLYIVAPPLGLLMLLSCLITLLVRYVRRRSKIHCYTGSSSKARRCKSSLRFGIRQLLLTNGGRFAPKKLSSSSSCSHSKNSCGRYLDDDIFEIVDDIDWSDGTNQSPKSQESLKLSAAATSSDESASPQQRPRLSNGVPTGRLLQATQPPPTTTTTKVGPVFATLRCQARNLKTATQISNQVQGSTLSRLNKSSTFIEPRDGQPARNNRRPNELATNSLSPKASLSSQMDDLRQQAAKSPSTANSGHLISCSSTTEDIEASSLEYCCREKLTRACDLALIGPECISIANQQQQPLYEGKFSQVQLAFVKRQTSHTCDQDLSSALCRSSMDIGAQVALCTVKSNANLDESIFKPTKLKLRNLNHLNLLKLIGYCTQTENEIGLRQEGSCSLIYDMGQLVDLNDWLRQQSKDIMMSCEPGGELGTRKNLTCFAKQVALAIDYLHDRGIVYKDLACRNCFLDPTKMLIKLASFNLEFAGNADGDDDNESAEEQQLNGLRSMIRPKYLLDYYVIDSRPTDSQLLPLSWIPLESILFNKFNMQTDVWSFGCLLYELFSLGEVAYFGYSSKQVIDAVRSNLMPPKPLLCPNGIYKLMCKCLSDIPSMRPNVKQIYEQLNLYSGQCSSFLDHHLCSLAATVEQQHTPGSMVNHQMVVSTSFKTNSTANSGQSAGQGSISKTKSYANIRNNIGSNGFKAYEMDTTKHDQSKGTSSGPEVAKIPLSKSINLATSSRLNSGASATETNHYDEPVVNSRD